MKKQIFLYQEKLGRLTGFLIFSFMLAMQFKHIPRLDGGVSLPLVRWLLVTFLFFLFWFAYVRRAPAKSLAVKGMEIFLPILCAGLPLFIISGPFWISKAFGQMGFFDFLNSILSLWSPWTKSESLEIAGYSLMAIGEIVTVAGMIYLGRSFSIFTEVRELVHRGPYRWVRHPLYSGEILSIWGFALARPNLWITSLTVFFTILQIYRAILEERKLLFHIPEYAELIKKTGRFFPKFFKT